MKLYDFQQDAVERCRSALSKVRSLILCSPTGSGKTVLACWLAARAVAKGKTVCILVDRKEILDQFARTLSKFQLYPALIVAGLTKIPRSKLYLGMVESFDRRFQKSEALLGIDFFMLDEAHSTSYFKIIKKARANKPAIIGLTATPCLTGTKERLNEYYEDIVELAKVEDLIRINKLCDSRTYSIDLAHEDRLRAKSGEFTADSQMSLFGEVELYHGVVDNFQRICPDARFICYNVNVEHSIKMCQIFNINGIKCRHVDGSTDPATRKEIFQQLSDGTIQGVHNFGICTTGFDEPGANCIIQNFATNSLSKHIQTAGRGARIAEGKDCFYILDMGRNFSRHGLWNRNKDWTDIFNNPEQADEKDRQKTEALQNVNCGTCGYIVGPDLDACPICGTPVSATIANKLKQKKKTASKTAELKLIKEQAKERLPQHLKKGVEEMSYSELMEYASLVGHNKKWVFIQMGIRKKRFIERHYGDY